MRKGIGTLDHSFQASTHPIPSCPDSAGDLQQFTYGFNLLNSWNLNIILARKRCLPVQGIPVDEYS